MTNPVWIRLYDERERAIQISKSVFLSRLCYEICDLKKITKQQLYALIKSKLNMELARYAKEPENLLPEEVLAYTKVSLNQIRNIMRRDPRRKVGKQKIYRASIYDSYIVYEIFYMLVSEGQPAVLRECAEQARRENALHTKIAEFSLESLLPIVRTMSGMKTLAKDKGFRLDIIALYQYYVEAAEKVNEKVKCCVDEISNGNVDLPKIRETDILDIPAAFDLHHRAAI